MKKLRSLFFYSIALFVFASLSGCTESSVNPVGGGGGVINMPTGGAPSFTLFSVDGGQVSLSDFAGKPLVIFFFGSSCPLCVASAPSVESGINQQFDNTEINIIGIDTWDGNQVAVDNFRTTTGVTFDLLLMGSNVEEDYDTIYDRLVVINAEGKIAFKGNSRASSDVDDVVALLEDLLM